jgi:hypothetical protein
MNPPKEESIRAWYERTTRRSRRILLFASITALLGGIVFISTVSLKTAQFVQTTMGAVGIPTAGAIWVAVFVYVFLVPSREVSFRSQESIEKTVDILNDAVERKLGPAVKVWERLGERLEKEIQAGLVEDVKKALTEIREASGKIEKSAENSNGEIKRLADDARPALEALQKLHARIEKNIGAEFVDDVKLAVRALRDMSTPPVPAGAPGAAPGAASPGTAQPKVSEPDLEKALQIVSKKKPIPAAAKAPERDPAPVSASMPAPAAKEATHA